MSQQRSSKGGSQRSTAQQAFEHVMQELGLPSPKWFATSGDIDQHSKEHAADNPDVRYGSELKSVYWGLACLSYEGTQELSARLNEVNLSAGDAHAQRQQWAGGDGVLLYADVLKQYAALVRPEAAVVDMRYVGVGQRAMVVHVVERKSAAKFLDNIYRIAVADPELFRDDTVRHQLHTAMSAPDNNAAAFDLCAELGLQHQLGNFTIEYFTNGQPNSMFANNIYMPSVYLKFFDASRFNARLLPYMNGCIARMQAREGRPAAAAAGPAPGRGSEGEGKRKDIEPQAMAMEVDDHAAMGARAEPNKKPVKSEPTHNNARKERKERKRDYDESGIGTDDEDDDDEDTADEQEDDDATDDEDYNTAQRRQPAQAAQAAQAAQPAAPKPGMLASALNALVGRSASQPKSSGQLSSSSSSNQPNQPNKSSSQPKSSDSQPSKVAEPEYVYRTAKGKHYHKAGCRHAASAQKILKSESRKLKLSKASCC